MATTGVLNGTSLLMYVGGVAIGSATTHSLSVQMSPRDATTKDTAPWAVNLEGKLSWSASGSGLLTFDDTYGYDELMTLIAARTSIVLKLSTEVTGDTYWQGNARLTSLTQDSPVEDNTTYSFEFVGTGALTAYTGT